MQKTLKKLQIVFLQNINGQCHSFNKKLLHKIIEEKSWAEA